MPIYEYQCNKCGKVTEALRRMAEADQPQPCEHCGHKTTHRMHSVFAAAGSQVELPVGAGCAGPTPSGGCCMGGQCRH
ncbi:MAG: zinc ribbon domain-containing protein [Phycisphaeraceae bacterium]|nr:zinc ribbon domain-containing protein [Phycisphaeraceae bacterium]